MYPLAAVNTVDCICGYMHASLPLRRDSSTPQEYTYAFRWLTAAKVASPPSTFAQLFDEYK